VPQCSTGKQRFAKIGQTAKRGHCLALVFIACAKHGARVARSAGKLQPLALPDRLSGGAQLCRRTRHEIKRLKHSARLGSARHVRISPTRLHRRSRKRHVKCVSETMRRIDSNVFHPRGQPLLKGAVVQTRLLEASSVSAWAHRMTETRVRPHGLLRGGEPAVAAVAQWITASVPLSLYRVNARRGRRRCRTHANECRKPNKPPPHPQSRADPRARTRWSCRRCLRPAERRRQARRWPHAGPYVPQSATPREA